MGEGVVSPTPAGPQKRPEGDWYLRERHPGEGNPHKHSAACI